MPSAEQLRALFLSHLEGDEDRFYSVAMQVAAHEARCGHGKLAEELRSILDDSKRSRRTVNRMAVSRPPSGLDNLLIVSSPKTRLVDMVLDSETESQIKRVIREQYHATLILKHGLSPRRKLLLVGPPGTGKTMTASVLAGELNIPLFQVRLDGLITRFMGETAAKLRQVFDATGETRGVYFFDEFDAIGSERGLGTDVGEIRRVLNSFLQMIEQDRSHSLIVAATNHPHVLDYALFRRFDDVIQYRLPGPDQIMALLYARLSRFVGKGLSWETISKHAGGLSYAEIVRAAEEAIKTMLIEGRPSVTEIEIRGTLEERKITAMRVETNNGDGKNTI